MNAFETLGLRWDADQAQVHAAYRSEEALRIAAKRQIGFNTVSCEDAKTLARKLMEQGRNENALRQLARADSKDAQWYCLQGEILMNLHQYDSAHQSFREAVRREPDNLQFRRGAFNAAMTLKKHQRPVQRAVDAVGRLFGKK